jgi:hypothetical protein
MTNDESGTVSSYIRARPLQEVIRDRDSSPGRYGAYYEWCVTLVPAG